MQPLLLPTTTTTTTIMLYMYVYHKISELVVTPVSRAALNTPVRAPKHGRVRLVVPYLACLISLLSIHTHPPTHPPRPQGKAARGVLDERRRTQKLYMVVYYYCSGFVCCNVRSNSSVLGAAARVCLRACTVRAVPPPPPKTPTPAPCIYIQRGNISSITATAVWERKNTHAQTPGTSRMMERKGTWCWGVSYE